MLCLLPGMRPDGISLLGRSSPAAGFVRVNLRLSTPCRSSRGTSDRRMALAWALTSKDLIKRHTHFYITPKHLLSILNRKSCLLGIIFTVILSLQAVEFRSLILILQK